MPILISALISSAITITLLFIVATVPSFPMLLGTRFLGQYGLVQIALHALYSFILTYIFLGTKSRSKVRNTIWTLFSVIFFSQLLLGLLGWGIFLQTGNLHYPVPTLIISGPIFRGSGFFMLTLLASTMLLVGSSWCSHLCYAGAIDNLLANKNKKKRPTPSWFRYIRLVTLLLSITIPLILKLYFEVAVAHSAIISFIGISALFFLLSYRYGKMIHCTYFCPIGLVTNVTGKFHPFKIKIDKSCDGCGVCTLKCKYGALSPLQLKKGVPDIRCTLCMDCTDVCHNNSIGLRVFGRKKMALPLFYSIVVALHSVFLAVARI